MKKAGGGEANGGLDKGGEAAFLYKVQQVAFQISASIWNFIVSMWYGADPVVFTSYGECVQVCSCRDAACEY
ncbi:unnamed protein product [Camellia sinensis]